MARGRDAVKGFVAALPGRRRPLCAVYAAVVRVPFGKVGVRIDGRALVGVDYLPMEHAVVAPMGPLACEAVRQIHAYVEDPRHRFDLPFDAAGTTFQHSVWRAIIEIPCGSTRTYGQVAAALGSAPRAVGAACGSNPIPLIIPCHRVVSAGGRLGGFMHSRAEFPLAIKRWLLEHETS